MAGVPSMDCCNFDPMRSRVRATNSRKHYLRGKETLTEALMNLFDFKQVGDPSWIYAVVYYCVVFLVLLSMDICA